MIWYIPVWNVWFSSDWGFRVCVCLNVRNINEVCFTVLILSEDETMLRFLFISEPDAIGWGGTSAGLDSSEEGQVEAGGDLNGVQGEGGRVERERHGVDNLCVEEELRWLLTVPQSILGKRRRRCEIISDGLLIYNKHWRTFRLRTIIFLSNQDTWDQSWTRRILENKVWGGDTVDSLTALWLEFTDGWSIYRKLPVIN